MYPPHHQGGYELMWRSNVRSLRGAGHEVRVLTTDYRNPELHPGDPEDPGVHRELGWYWRDHDWPRLSPFERLRLERRNHAVLVRHIEDFEPDVVAWWAMGGMSLSMIEQARRRGVPGAGVVVDDWLIYGPTVDGWLRGMGRVSPARAAIARLTGIPTKLDIDESLEWIVVSDSVRRYARQAGWRLPKSRVAHAGVDLHLFRPADSRSWEWRLLVLGRLDPRKGIATAIRALAELPQASLDIVGRGDERHGSELEALAMELGVAARVRFCTAPRDQLPEVYAAADAVVFPVLWHEPFGIVPLEAMAVGRPVVATGTGGSGEYLRHAENCLVFSPSDDAVALAAAVRRLAENPSLREQLRSAGLETAAANGEDRFNREVEAALERAAGSRPGATFDSSQREMTRTLGEAP